MAGERVGPVARLRVTVIRCIALRMGSIFVLRPEECMVGLNKKHRFGNAAENHLVGRFVMKPLSTGIVKSAWRGLVPVFAVVVLSLAFAQGAEAQGKKVNMFLDWDGLTGHHMGPWLAKDKGWFAANGLDVRIVPGRGSGQVGQVVAGNRAEFGYISSAVLIQQVAKQDAPLISVSVSMQRDNLAMAYFESSGIKTPKDIEGKKYGMVPGGVAQLLWPAFARVNGIDLNKVQVIKTSYQLFVPQFKSGMYDVSGDYAVGSKNKIAFEKGGEKVKHFVFSDYLPILGKSIIVRKDYLKNNPKMVLGFVRAMDKAWKYVDTQPDKAIPEAAKIAVSSVSTRMPASTIAMFARMSIPSYLRSKHTKGKPIGWSRAEDWRKMIDFMAEVDKFPRKPKVSEVWTNRFYE